MKKLQSVKKGLAIFLTIAMLVGVMPGIGVLHVSAEGITVSRPEGDGSAENPYLIGTREELYWFAGLVNGDASVCDYNADTNPTGTQQDKAACAKLTADIVVNSGDVANCGGYKQDGWIDWTPIAYGNSLKYSGTFDGQGHEISGLYYKNTAMNKNFVGLFGDVYDGSVCNVGVVNSYIEAFNYVGGVCGRIYNSGSDTALTISNCYNTGTVKGARDGVGGVFGYVQNAGSDASITVTNCYNSGNVYLTGTSTSGNAGGVCGYLNNSGTNATVTLTKCYNTGNVIAAGSSSKRIGGVCGRCDKATISNCYNTGAVTANGRSSTDVGGVCGYLYATSTIPAKLINCHSVGTPATPYKSNSNLGGICGYASTTNATVDACYFLDTTAKKGIGSGSGTTASKTADRFASGEVAWLLNGSTSEGTADNPLVWYQKLGKGGNAYPVLKTTGDNTVFTVTCGGNDTYTNNGALSGATVNHDFSAKNGICITCGYVCDHADGYDENDECKTCGKSQYVTFDTHSLTLGDEIGVNFMMIIAPEARTEGAYMEFSVSGTDGMTTQILLTDAVVLDDGRYKFTCLVSSIQMADTITATYHYGDGKAVTEAYSVKMYIEAVVASDAMDAKTKDLAKALADYGYYAQLCLSATNGWTIGTDHEQMIHYSDAMDTTVDLSAYAYAQTGEVSGMIKVNKSLRLDSKTAIRLLFTVDGTYGKEPVITVKNAAGETVEAQLTRQSDGRFCLMIPGIYAHKLSETYTIVVDGSMTIQMSALSYAHGVLESETMSEDAKQAVAALNAYYNAAIAYKN